MIDKIRDNDELYEQYFTKVHVAQDAIKLILNDLKKISQIDIFGTSKIHFIEPSCGEGVFVKELKKINENIKVTGLDIDFIYQNAIIYNFLKADKNILNIKEDEITVFFGCPPSELTKYFIKHCKNIDKNSIVYFILRETLLRECIENNVIVFRKILKHYGNNVFLFRNTDFTTQSSYILTKVIFAPDVHNRHLQKQPKS